MDHKLQLELLHRVREGLSEADDGHSCDEVRGAWSALATLEDEAIKKANEASVAADGGRPRRGVDSGSLTE